MTLLNLLLKTLLWLLVAGVLLVFVINSFDEPPSAAVKAALAPATQPVPESENGLYAVIGLRHANSATGPEALIASGLAQLPAIQQQPTEEATAEKPALVFVGTHDNICGVTSQSPRYPCLAYAQQHRAELLKALADNAELLRRYRCLQQFPRLSRRGPLDADDNSKIPWQMVLNGGRLLHADIALRLSQGEHSGIAELAADLHHWRSWLENSDNLIDKMISVSAIRNGLNASAGLIASGLLQTREIALLHAEMQPLTREERSLQRSFQYEIRSTQKLLSLEMMKATAPPRKNPGPVGDAVAALYWHFYQPQASSNRNAQWLEATMAQDTLPCVQQTPAQQWSRRNQRHWTYWARNPIGAWMLGMLPDTEPLPSHYTLRLCNLDGILRIAALQAAIAEQHIAPAAVAHFVETVGPAYANPYTGQPMQWLPGEGLSFELQGDDKRMAVVLPWAL
jgi:hypothetical protein